MSSNATRNERSEIRTGDETTPLLTAVEPIPIRDSATVSPQQPDYNDSRSEDEQEDTEDEVPLPKAQVFLLCYTAIVEPIAFFGIFPYINLMIEKVGSVKKEEVGFYSGLIESLFSATQMCVMLFWGRVRTLCIQHCVLGTYFHRHLIDTGGNQSSSFP
jgi:hypothetical protein